MPADAATRLQSLRSVELLGRVADSGQFMSDCAVLALPVFIRGGVPLKVIEAMARGKAIVASPELIDGLALTDGEEMLVRNDMDSFAAAIVTLLRDSGLRKQLGIHARSTFVRDFSMSSAERVLRRDSVIAREFSLRP
jgi:glycosyltransferase involved in cell wall biosynthesis